MHTNKKTREWKNSIPAVLAQREGFAPLAARPAPPLSMASFAVKSIVTLTRVGKAFCSRKTALLAQSAVISALGRHKCNAYAFVHLVPTRRYQRLV